MSGVQDLEECPQCKYEFAFSEFETRNYHYYIHCTRCGYLRRTDESAGIVIEEHAGFGAYNISYTSGYGTFGSFHEGANPGTVSQYIKDAKAHAKNNNLEINWDETYFTLCNGGEEITEIFGHVPGKEYYYGEEEMDNSADIHDTGGEEEAIISFY